ncbi:putative [Myosin heavy-chain] kinase transcription factor WD40-like family [Helianthus annuus]|uniref:Putative transducin/WD40 repeat-like superfamily protein n=1 Tax=Helianthus annuus TaxID=4232 RepID=A0A251T6G6_HELAN|nr:protein JINGUBANG [Helianthus annuus]KAF5779722.1 putative [Myosin heavy-chain] kinase transcription factor WD40-like family [Helianthus annuus]KAJ0490985.1 putative [Myosin heavy-chain] kinase transcription factor WD40-like family [Helianthus annuus]KAJ0495337.1 putative [Myosin heavy-chain] kinase transcription factor WD40-like family [Helianthus annuus]KAJ0506890.1 putative [Myosin heavy-chain] kinase transcription factor WD40-like family [Helianthus annuus]KAJ0676528.1 putative [Myosin 
MGFLPCPCTLSSKSSSKHHKQQESSSPDLQQKYNISDTKSISSLPSLPSVQSLTSHSQPPSTTANHHYITTFKAHTSPIFSLTLTNNHLISASSDGHIRIWPRDPSRDQSVQPPLATLRSAAKTMVVCDNKFLFTGHQDHKIRVWKLDDVNKTVKCVAVLPTLNDRLMKLVFAKNYVKIRRHRRCTWVHHVDAVSTLALSKDGSLVYSGSWDRTFKVWRTSDYKCLESVWNAHDDAINAVVVSHDCVYTGSADRKIKVWRRDSGEKKHKLVDTLEKHISAVNALAISTDGSVLYSGACDRSIIVWEKGGGDGRHMAVAGALRGHSKAILCIAVVDDVVFSGSADKTIRVWRRSIDGKKYWCLGVLEGHKGPIKCLAAAVEGCTSGSNGGTSYLVYGGSLDCEIKMWKLWVPFL